LPLAQSLYRLVVGRTFDSTVPRIVIRGAVLIVFLVSLIVLVTVRDEIVERKTVVRRDKIDVRPRLTASEVEEIARRSEPRR
jgi:hypothetical protein